MNLWWLRLLLGGVMAIQLCGAVVWWNTWTRYKARLGETLPHWLDPLARWTGRLRVPSGTRSRLFAGVAKQADADVLKTSGYTPMRVRVPPSALEESA